MNQTKLTLAALLLATHMSIGTASTCQAMYKDPSCQCGSEVQKKVPSPKGFTAQAACFIQSPISSFSDSVSFSKKIWQAEIHYKGESILTGVFSIHDDGPSGTVLSFLAKHPPKITGIPENTSIAQHVRLDTIYISPIDYNRLQATKFVESHDKVDLCAAATIRLKDFTVYIADTDGNPVSAKKFDVLKLDQFHPC